MRLWDEKPGGPAVEDVRDYEVVGYVLEGRAELQLEGGTVHLGPGDSYVVPRGAHHRYRILEHFRTIEATVPPSFVHGRDEASPKPTEGVE
jgi:quercetin dioxygenase-like cupin family protein